MSQPNNNANTDYGEHKMGFNLGTFAGGVSKGANDVIDMWNKIDESQYRKEEQDEKRRIRKANEDFAKDLATLRDERKNGTGQFEDLLSDDVKASRQAPAGITTPGSEPVKPKTGSNNPLLDGGEGLYRNQKLADDRYYNRLADLQERLYSVIDPAKAVMVREQMAELRDKDYERGRKTATAALLSGAPNALALANQAYGFQKDGLSIDTTSGKFDQKTGWSGVNIVDKDGKVVQTMNLNRDDIMNLYFASTPEKLVDFNMKSRDMQIKEKKLPFETDALAASAKKDRSIGNYYDGAKSQMDSVANDTRIESAFKPYLTEGIRKVESYMSDADKAKINAHNAQVEATVGTAIDLYKDPANKGKTSAGKMMDVSRQIYGMQLTRTADGVVGVDMSSWSIPKDSKLASTHYAYTDPAGGVTYVRKERIDAVIDRLRQQASTSSKK